jgi:hypothetical protein
MVNPAETSTIAASIAMATSIAETELTREGPSRA